MCMFALLSNFAMIVSPYLQVIVYVVCYFITITLNTIALTARNCPFGLAFEKLEN